MYLVKTNKSPFYQIIYFTPDGRRKSKSTGEKKKGEALLYLSNFKENLKKKEEIKSITFDEYQKVYLHYVQLSFSPKYYSVCKHSFTIFARSFGKLKLDEIQPAAIENFILTIFKKSKHAANLYLRNLKAAINKAVEWKYINENLFKKIKLPRVDKPLPCFITQNELDLILSHVTKPNLKDIYILLFHTGMRADEALHLIWDDINFQEHLITVTNKENFTTKNKKERSIPMNQTILSLLTKKYNSQNVFRLQNNYIFAKVSGIPLRVEYISKAFKKAVRKAKLNDKIHLHSLRHSFCSNLVSKGVSLYVVKELAGHENITTTQIYAHLQRDTLREAILKLD